MPLFFHFPFPPLLLPLPLLLLLPVLAGHPPAVGVGRRQLAELVVSFKGRVGPLARRDRLDVAEPDALVDLLRSDDLEVRVGELLPPVGDVADGKWEVVLNRKKRRERRR